ncbi:MAG: hypothetical protein OEX81_03585 [Candidatus Pacebacteria bacterium]|nr:hypothetical protein [Candidatus Paceibacterota bacterium]
MSQNLTYEGALEVLGLSGKVLLNEALDAHQALVLEAKGLLELMETEIPKLYPPSKFIDEAHRQEIIYHNVLDLDGFRVYEGVPNKDILSRTPSEVSQIVIDAESTKAKEYYNVTIALLDMALSTIEELS